MASRVKTKCNYQAQLFAGKFKANLTRGRAARWQRETWKRVNESRRPPK